MCTFRLESPFTERLPNHQRSRGLNSITSDSLYTRDEKRRKELPFRAEAQCVPIIINDKLQKSKSLFSRKKKGLQYLVWSVGRLIKPFGLLSGQKKDFLVTEFHWEIIEEDWGW